MHQPAESTKPDPTAGKPPAAPPGAPTNAFIFAVAAGAIALGYALQISGGTYHPAALSWLTVALLCCLAAVVLTNDLIRVGRSAVVALLGGGLILQLALLYSKPPGVYLAVRSAAHLAPFLTGVTVLGVLAAAGLSAKPWPGRAHVPLMLMAFFFCGAWVIRASPNPHIDTYS
ncbi:MAG: hypothetical protein M3478_06860, partial [Planctomycetota bacterium]|nr:hypothetical protein [Planctomycetota bacterium]